MKHYILFFVSALLIFDGAFSVDFPKPQQAPSLGASVGFPKTFQDLSKDSRNNLRIDGYEPYVDKSAYQELNLVKDPNANKADIRAEALWGELDCRDYGWSNIKYGEKPGEKHTLRGSMSAWFKDANIELLSGGWCEGQEEHTDDPCYCENQNHGPDDGGLIDTYQGDKVIMKYVEKVTDDMFVTGRRGSFNFFVRDHKNLQFQLYGAASCINDKNAKPKYRQTNGQYCFCKPEFSFKCTDKNGCSAVGDYVDHYKPTYADWVYMGDKGTTQNCIQSCTKDCVRAATLKKPGFFWYPDGYKQDLGEYRTGGTVTVSSVKMFSKDDPYGHEEDTAPHQEVVDEVFHQN